MWCSQYKGHGYFSTTQRRQQRKTFLLLLSRESSGDSLGYLSRSLADCAVLSTPSQLAGQSNFRTEGRYASVIRRSEMAGNFLMHSWAAMRFDEDSNFNNSNSSSVQSYTCKPFPVIDLGTCPVHGPVHFQSNYSQATKLINSYSHLDYDKSASVA